LVKVLDVWGMRHCGDRGGAYRGFFLVGENTTFEDRDIDDRTILKLIFRK
jgi:hypothetical protein